jgi:hypothetical protein
MIERLESIEFILNNVPEFKNIWQKHHEEWAEENVGHCNDMYPFVDFAVEYIQLRDSEMLKRIFAVAEHLLINGSEEVKTAVATCFLESLINRASTGKIDSNFFVKYLGENSKLHCKAWDEFSGAQTIGL